MRTLCAQKRGSTGPALGLFLPSGAPVYYLITDHAALDDLTDATLDRLAQAKVISTTLRDVQRNPRLSSFYPQPRKPRSRLLSNKKP